MMKVIKEAKKIAGELYVPLFYPLMAEEVRHLDEQYYINEGIKEGIKQNKIEMIINMYNDNLPIEIISKYSNLSLSEVDNIIKSFKE